MGISKILIVDDSPTERHVLNDLLTKAGFEVVTSDNGEDAIVKAQAGQARPHPDGRRDAGPQRLPGHARDQPRSGHAHHPDHPVHVQEPGDRQDLGHAPGCPRLRREARRSRRAARARSTRSARAPRARHGTAPRSSTCARSSRSWPPVSRPRRAAQVESSRLGLSCARPSSWLIRLADAGEVITVPTVAAVPLTQPVVPRHLEHPRQPLQRHRLLRGFLGASRTPSPPGMRAPPDPVRRPRRRAQRRPRRAAACSACATSPSCTARTTALDAPAWYGRALDGCATATPGRRSTSPGSRDDPAFLQVGA